MSDVMVSELAELFEQGVWYHRIVHEQLKSNGAYDLQDYLQHYAFDADYAGKSIMDVGCSDGFFSLLFKQRGASRVLGVDSNRYDGSPAIAPSLRSVEHYRRKYLSYRDEFERFGTIYRRFGLSQPNKLLLLAKLKRLDVEFQNGSVYDLKEFGQFDMVFCGDLLEHLKDPITAIEQIYSATRQKAIISCSSAMRPTLRARLLRRPLLTYRGHQAGGSFFEISEQALVAMCKAAGFTSVDVKSRFEMANLKLKAPVYHVVVHAHK
jgi:tRNA (mo5U34)-methyltransferase